MIRKLKILTAALVAVLALGVAVGAASAAQFHSEKQLTTIKGVSSSTHEFTTPAAKVTCQGASFLGIMPFATQVSLTLLPSFSNCDLKVTGGSTIAGAAVKLNECDFEISANGRHEVKCPAGSSGIEFSVAGCVLTIRPQIDESAISYANSGSHVQATFEGTEVFYKTSGLLCGATEGSKGSYTGAATLSGEQGGMPVKIRWE
ncbi:MAG TPA: hypothetical protein VF255_08455 [Solirubrobacterales bacterium]